MGRILQYDHDDQYLLSALRAYPSDGTIAPTPLLQHLYGDFWDYKPNHRPSSVLSGDFANKALVDFVNLIDSGNALGQFTKVMNSEVLSELETLSAKPLDKNFAFFVARSLMKLEDLNVDAIHANASINPALYATLIERWSTLSSAVQDSIKANLPIVVQQGVGTVKAFLKVADDPGEVGFVCTQVQPAHFVRICVRNCKRGR